MPVTAPVGLLQTCGQFGDVDLVAVVGAESREDSEQPGMAVAGDRRHDRRGEVCGFGRGWQRVDV